MILRCPLPVRSGGCRAIFTHPLVSPPVAPQRALKVGAWLSWRWVSSRANSVLAFRSLHDSHLEKISIPIGVRAFGTRVAVLFHGQAEHIAGGQGLGNRQQRLPVRPCRCRKWWCSQGQRGPIGCATGCPRPVGGAIAPGPSGLPGQIDSISSVTSKLRCACRAMCVQAGV